MRHRRVSRPCVACLLAGLASVASVRAQAPPGPTQASVLPPVSVELVRVDVVVTDKGGHPKAGLAREDFAVFEDGEPQKLVQFEAYARRLPGTLPAPSPPAVTVADETRRPLPRRYVVLAADDVHIEPGSLMRAKKALTRFVEEDVGPEDRVALVTTSGALSQEFTTDRDALRQAISRLSARAHVVWAGVPYISEYQAELIERGDRDALAVAVEQILYERGINANAEVEAKQKARAIFEESVHNARLTLETLENLIRNMAGLSGRKVLFLVSDGFLVGLSAHSGLGYDIRSITDAGTRAGVVVYSLETRGLTAPIPGGSASTRGPAIARTFSRVFSMEQQSEEATRNAMHALAADTGGFLFDNSNDLHAGLKRMLEDTETYYVLAYEPTNTKRDGAFRHIEVRVPGQRDVKVRARAGYFAPGDRRASSSRVPEKEERRTQGRPSGTGGARAPLAAILVHLSADFVSFEGGVTEVVVSGHVDTTTLPFVRQGDRYKAAVEMTAVVHDETGAVAATLGPQRLSLDMTETQHERLSREGLPYQKTAPLKPGRYEVRLVVGGAGAGALGVASQWVEIPDLAPGRLTLSSLFLLKAGEVPGGTGDSGAPLVLSQARRRFRWDESLYVQVYAYNPMRDASGRTDLVWQGRILRGGVVVEAGTPEPMEAGERDGPPVPHTSKIALDPFGPGEYELEVTVTDRNANEAATRRVGFTID
jgi:VWFA-related protein